MALPGKCLTSIRAADRCWEVSESTDIGSNCVDGHFPSVFQSGLLPWLPYMVVGVVHCTTLGSASLYCEMSTLELCNANPHNSTVA